MLVALGFLLRLFRLRFLTLFVQQIGLSNNEQDQLRREVEEIVFRLHFSPRLAFVWAFTVDGSLALLSTPIAALFMNSRTLFSRRFSLSRRHKKLKKWRETKQKLWCFSADLLSAVSCNSFVLRKWFVVVVKCIMLSLPIKAYEREFGEIKQ